jgi:hypothetical protein
MLTHFRLPQWYAIATAASAALLLLHHIGSVCSAFLISRFQFVFLKFVVYPLVVRRRWWNWIAVNRLQGATISSYVIINGFCMGLGIKTTSDLIIRSGLMASINMIPLFLGGRTNTLASFLGISLHTYYLAHHWIGRIVILQSLIHVFLVIAHRVPWTFDSSQISGISVSLPNWFATPVALKLTPKEGYISAGADISAIISLRSKIDVRVLLTDSSNTSFCCSPRSAQTFTPDNVWFIYFPSSFTIIVGL